MADKVLILGGNRFFGRHLALELLRRGHMVTLLNRGIADDELGARVKRIHVDRQDRAKLTAALAETTWDYVIDQICYDAPQAQMLCEILQHRTGRVYFTSTQSVYGLKLSNTENDFNPYAYAPSKVVSQSEDYGEAKRQAEVAFAKFAHLNPVMLRFPIVLGNDDYTKRLLWHVESVARGLPMYFPNLDAQMGFIRSDMAGQLIAQIAQTDFVGPLNCASPGTIRLRDLIAQIEQAVGRKAIYSSAELDESGARVHSPYGVENDWAMNLTRLETLGVAPDALQDWLPGLINELAEKVDRTPSASGS